MREITSHRVNPTNDRLTLEVLDEPGPDGACHLYTVRGYLHDNNPALGRLLALPAEVGNETPIVFQNGGVAEVGVNGLTHEVLLAILIDRLDSFQNGPYRCTENGQALWALKKARDALAARTSRRVAEGTEGTLQLDEQEQPGKSSGNPIMRFFAYEHLPAHLQEASRPLAEIAQWANATLKDGPEKSQGLRKLLEAKDCFVRATL